ncbi:GerAB/ArcD/ProY family transporter [Paenibacillus sp. GCM10012306]|uniref:GerAB/ArcD/ProY family transporter n=1 Tax=Paenibacillus sp. GCM10012306 TaxID=3317342 RepID=UPI003617867A
MRTTKWQLTRFAFIYMNSQASIFLVPTLISSPTYQSWMAVMGGTLLSIGMMFCAVYVGRLKPGQAWVDFGGSIVGKWVHKIVIVLLLCWCIYYVSLDLENFVLFFGSNYLRGTPPWFIQLLIGLVIMYTAKLRFSSLIYMTDGLFLLIVSASLFTVFLFVQEVDLNMLPALIHYHDPIIAAKDSWIVTSWVSEWVVFLFIVPELKLDKNVYKKLTVASLLVMVSILIGWLLTLLSLGAYLGPQIQFPFLEMIRSSTHDNIIGNIDPLLIGVWSSSLFIHSAFLIYVAVRCLSNLTKNKGKKYMVEVLTLIALVIAYLYSQNVAKYNRDYNSAVAIWIWFAVDCLPVFYFIVALVRFRKRPLK